VVGRQRRLVCGAERGGEFLRLAAGFDVRAEGLGGEVQAAGEPEEAFGGGVGFCGGEFGAGEGLEGGAGGGGGELAVADFLDGFSR
jgi:hypothetical protein